MGNLSNTKKLLIGLFLVVFLGGLLLLVRQLQERQDPRSRAAGEAVNFTITPSTQNVTLGNNATFDIALQAQTNNTTGIDITLSFDPTKVQTATWQPAAHGFSNTLNNGVVNMTAGTIRFTVVNVDPTQMPSTIQLGRVVLTTKALGTSNLSISKSQVTAAGIDTALPVNPITPATYTVNPVPTNTPLPTATPIPPTPTRTPTPLPPTNTPTVTPTRTPTPLPPTATTAPLVGDYNRDGKVDLLDFNLWKDEYLEVVPTRQADGNNDTIIDLVDFAIWRNVYIKATANSPSTPTLLASYVMKKDTPGNVPYGPSLYFPRKFVVGKGISGLNIVSTGSFNEWDLYTGVPPLSSLEDTVTLYLNRPATLAVIWRENNDMPLPTWLTNWTPSGTVQVQPDPYTFVPNQGTYPVYKKSFPAGKVTLGAIINPGQTICSTGCTYTPAQRRGYYVLLAEENGQPSTPPSVPAGKEVPLANQKCPAWVHDQYVTTGPDGKKYATWHNIVDPVYWCTFGHEHGADPRLLSPDYVNAFEYTASKHGMTEGHPGFKNMVFNSGGYRWMIMSHLGTAGRARLCNSFHTVEIAAVDPATSEIVADLKFMGNFGPAVSNTEDRPLSPPECPDQFTNARTIANTGLRKIPVLNIPGTPAGYEPWRLGPEGTVLGFENSFLINQFDTITTCEDLTCATLQNTGNTGTNRFYQGSTFAVKAGSKGQNTGTFCTDPLGREFLDCNDHHAIKQYLKPGFYGKITSDGTMDHESFGRMWSEPRTAQPANRENAVTTGPN
jgi:hypothetical protein